MIAHLNTALPAARALLLGASALAMNAPLAANDLLFSTNNARPETGLRMDQRGGLTQVALTGGGVVSIVDAAEYRLNADGSIDLYEGAITVAGAEGREVVVRMPEGLEGRIAGAGSAGNFSARKSGEASGHALTGAVRIGRGGAFQRFAAGELWRADSAGGARRVIANGAQVQPDAAPAVIAIGGDAGPVAAAINGLPVGFGDQLASAGASADIVLAARRIEAAVGNPSLDTFPSGDLALLVAAAARLETSFGGRPFPEAQADIIRAYLRFLAGGGTGSGFVAAYSRFVTDYLELIRAGGLPSGFAGASPADVEAYLSYIRRTGALTGLAARDRVLAEAYLAFLAGGGANTAAGRDGFAASFTRLTAAYFTFVRGGGDPAAFTGASEAALAQTIAFLRDSGLVVQLAAADRALVEAYLANGGLAFAGQYRAALNDYFAFLASGRRPSEYAALDQATLRAYLETLASTGLLASVLGERAGFYTEYLAFLRGGGAVDAFAGLPANIFAGYAVQLDAYFAFLAGGRLPSEFRGTDLATLQAWIAQLQAAGALERFLGQRAGFFAQYAAFVAAGGSFDAFAGLPIYAQYVSALNAYFAFLQGGGLPSAYTVLDAATIQAYLTALARLEGGLTGIAQLNRFFVDYFAFIASGGNPDRFAALPANATSPGGTTPPAGTGGTPEVSPRLANALFIANGGALPFYENVTLDVAADGQIRRVTLADGTPLRFPNLGGTTNAFDSRGWEVLAAGRFGNAVAFTSYLARSSGLGSNDVYDMIGGTPAFNIPQTGVVSYRLVGGSAPADLYAAPGSRDFFTGNLAVAFGTATPRVGIDFEIVAGPVTYAARTAGGAANPLNFGLEINSAGRFSGGLQTSVVSGPGCSVPAQCSANVTGGLFGENAGFAGFVYSLRDFSNQSALRAFNGSAIFGREGVALAGLGTRPATGGTTTPPPPPPPPPPPLAANGVVPGEAVRGVVLAYTNAGFGRLGTVGSITLNSGRYVANSELAGGMRLNYLANAATVTETGGDQGVIGWQRDENVRVELRNRNNLNTVSEQRANLSWHTVWGSPVTNLPTAGVINFDLIGATRATQSNGQGGFGTFDGRLVVDFATFRIGIDASVDFGGVRYAFATNGGTANPTLALASFFNERRFDATLATTANGAVVSGGTAVQGFLAGNGASHAGMTYSIRAAANNAIEGAAAFASRTASTAAATGMAANSALPADWSRWTAGAASTGAAPASTDPASASGWSAPAVSAFEGIGGEADRATAIRKAEALLGGMITFPADTQFER